MLGIVILGMEEVDVDEFYACLDEVYKSIEDPERCDVMYMNPLHSDLWYSFQLIPHGIEITTTDMVDDAGYPIGNIFESASISLDYVEYVLEKGRYLKD